jgi:uncharacterized protein YndB with AHSA1/START domain
MTHLDVTAETTIGADRDRVAAYAMDPRNDPIWIGGIKHVEVLTDGPVEKGSTVRRLAGFMGKRIEYVMEIIELEPGRRLTMHAIRSPFPMDVTYTFEDAGAGTRVRIRVEGDPGAAYRLAGPFLPALVRRPVAGDLRRLKRIMERP